MNVLRINYRFDEQLTVALEQEVNYYLEMAKTKGICTHIEKFEFFDPRVKKTYMDNYNTKYSISMKGREYIDCIVIIYELGSLKGIYFETLRTEWDGVIKKVYGFSDGVKVIPVNRGLSVSENGEFFYERVGNLVDSLQ